MADALASGASVRKDVGVQVPPRALIVNLLKLNALLRISIILQTCEDIVSAVILDLIKMVRIL